MAIVTVGTTSVPVIGRGVVPRYCHGCGERLADGTIDRWCSTGCFRAEDGDERIDPDYDDEDW